MSTEHDPLVTTILDNKDVQVTAFSGGKARGKCVQLTQSGTGYVQVTEEQAQQLVKTLKTIYNVEL